MQPVLVFSTPQFSRSFKNMLEFKLFQKIFFQEAKFSLVCDWLSWSEKILKILTIYTLLSHPWLRAVGEDSPSSQNVFFGNSISPVYCHRLFGSLIFCAILCFCLLESASVHNYITWKKGLKVCNLLNVCETKVYFLLLEIYSFLAYFGILHL